MAALDTPVNFHRVIKHSLDDREVFSSAEDLMDYCQNGAWYKGQRVAVNFDDGVTMNYIISSYNDDNNNEVGQPIIDMPIFDPVWYKVSSTSNTEYNGYYMMVYYYNDKNNEWLFPSTTSNSLLTYLKNPYRFVIGDTYAIFDKDTYYRYIVKYREYDTNSEYHPDTRYESSSNMIYTNNILNLPAASKNACLLPTTSSNNNYIIKVYMKADNYYYASEVY